MVNFIKDKQYYKFCAYGFIKNLKFFEPFLFIYLLSNEFSFLQIGVLYSIKEITINIFEIPSGIFADSFGRRKAMILAFLFYIISLILFYFSQKYIGFIVAIMFFAIGDAFRTGNHKAMIFHYLKLNGWQNAKVEYYGHTRSYSQLGSSISAIIAAIIVIFSGEIRYIFLFTIIPYVFELFLMISYPKELDGTLKEASHYSLIEKIKLVINNFFQSLKNPLILKSTLNLSLYTGFFKSIKEYIQPLIKTLALSIPIYFFETDDKKIAVFIGIIYSITYLLTSICSRNSNKFLNLFKHYYKPLNLTIIIGFILGIIIGIFYDKQFYILSIVLFLLFYIIENLRKPIGIAYLSNLFNQKILSTALSFESQAQTLFAALFAPLIGFLADYFGLGIGLIIISVFMLVLSPVYTLRKA